MENEYFVQKFDEWNIRKKNIQFFERPLGEEIYFTEGDVWWCALGVNIGDESFGKGEVFRRPILILKKLSSDLCIALPLTSKIKTGTWFINININDNIRTVMLYQIRALDKKRFQFKIGELDEISFLKVKEKLKTMLELS